MLWLLLAVVILVVALYFIFSYFRLNDKSIMREAFSNTTFLTQTGQSLRFDEMAESATFREGEQVASLKITNYEDGILELSNTELTLQIIVIDAQLMFGSTGSDSFYLYKYGE